MITATMATTRVLASAVTKGHRKSGMAFLRAVVWLFLRNLTDESP
jgi:hypothetical protein